MLAGFVSGAADPAPAAAWSGGACPTSAGVTVVVDLSAFDAGVVIRCVSGTPSTGLEALAGVEHSVVQVASVPGFVCRIDGLPGPADESCATTPPATAYWTYWSAPRGGSWTYSPVGPAASRPKQGWVEGWAFTNGNEPDPPSVAPPALVAPTPPATAAPTPRPTPAPTSRPTPAASGSTPASIDPAPVGQPSPASPATPAPTLTPEASADPSSQEGSATPTASSTPRASPEPVGAATPRGGSGATGTIVGIGLIAAVGAAAVATQRRHEMALRG